MNLNYYEILKLPYNASQEDIKTSFKKLAMIYHPDRNENKSDILFKQINEAYSILSDPVKKKDYDSLLNINNFKEDEKEDLKIQTFIINIDFWDSINGLNSTFNINILNKYGKFVNVNVKINIPQLVNNGEIFKVYFEDYYFNVKINIFNNTNFTRDNLDLISHIDIPLHIALIGGNVKFSYLDNIFNINIEGGLTQGQSIKVPNGGIKKDIFSGDLILICNIIIPNKINERQKELIAEFGDIEYLKRIRPLTKFFNLFKKN